MSDDTRDQFSDPPSEEALPATGRVTGAAAGLGSQAGGAPSEERDRAERPARILVVEDEPSVRDIIVRVLEMTGYECDEASNGVEGLALVREGWRRYDLIFSNLSMPKMDGDAFFEAIRPLVTLRVPRILGSGSSADLVLPLALRTGACEAILYPFGLVELQEKFAWALQVKTAYGRKSGVNGIADEMALLYGLNLASGREATLFSTPVLLELLRGSDVRAARAASEALGGLTALRPPLPSWVGALLTSGAPAARVQSARAIGRNPMGLRAALRVLRPALQHPNRFVANLATSAIRDVLSIRH